MADWELLMHHAAHGIRQAPSALHERLRARHAARHPVTAPANIAHQESLSLSDHIALTITDRVGTMQCVVLFLAIGIGSLVGVLTNNAILGAVCGSLSSYVLQLVLLPLIMMGQNLQSRHAEQRAEADHELGQQTAANVARILAQLTQGTQTGK